MTRFKNFIYFSIRTIQLVRGVPELYKIVFMSQRNLGFLHLLIVYLAWGSTFLAIRIAVQGEGSFQPFTLAAARVGTAGLVLLAISFFRKEKLVLDSRTYMRL